MTTKIKLIYISITLRYFFFFFLCSLLLLSSFPPSLFLFFSLFFSFFSCPVLSCPFLSVPLVPLPSPSLPLLSPLPSPSLPFFLGENAQIYPLIKCQCSTLDLQNLFIMYNPNFVCFDQCLTIFPSYSP